MKKVTLNLKEMPKGAINVAAKKEKKRGGLAWFWDKITSPFSGTTESEILEKPAASSREKSRGALFWLWNAIKSPFVAGAGDVDAAITDKIAELGDLENPAQGLASTASSAGEALEGTGSLSNATEGLGQQFDEFASRVASRVGVEASPLVGKAIMAAVALGVVATGIFAARHFGASASFKSPYAPIASGINAHPSGPNSAGNAPMGSIGAGENTKAGLTANAGKNAIAQNPGKTVATNLPEPGVKTNISGGLGNLAQPALAGGAPVGESGAMPQYGGQAAQEAAMAKIQHGALANVMPMSIGGTPVNAGSQGFRGGRAFGGGRSLGNLRGMTGYNANMQGSSYDQAAQNAIGQFDNGGITSGGGISQGGATTGSQNASPSVNLNSTPGMTGGSGSTTGGGSQPLCQDISQLCSSAQITAGGEVVGVYPKCSCSTSITVPGQKATPWQKWLNLANGFIVAAALITGLLGAWILFGESLLGDPFTTGIGLGILSWAGIMTAAATAMTVAAMALAIRIGNMGGHQQAIQLYMEGAAIGVGLALDWVGGFWVGLGLVAALTSFIRSLTSLLSPPPK